MKAHGKIKGEFMDMPTTGSAPITTSDQVTKGTTETQGQVNNGDSVDFFSDLTGESTSDNVVKKEKKSELPAEAAEALKTGDKKAKDDKKEEAPKEKKDSKAEKVEDKDEKKPEKVESKKLKAKHGEAEIEIPEDAMVTVKINGKDETISLKDLQSQYSGKVQYDKKFSELDKDRKSYNQMKEMSESKIKAIFEEQDPEIRFYKMAEFSGKNPVEVRQKFLNDNINLLEKYYSMTEDEKKADALEYENRWLKHQSDTKAKAESAKQAQDELHRKVTELTARHKVTQDEFVSQYDQVESLIKEGKLEAEKLTPEFIVETIAKDKLWNSAESAIKEMGITLENAPQKLMNLVETSFMQGLNPSDLPDIVSELWGSKKIQKTIETKKQERQEFYEGTKESKPQPKMNNDVWSFDQI